ncbi:MAG TPA: 30S ribosomal protein S14 [Gemmatimonadaceae bacterium]|jgi:small subunit ribosomal protein S14|nr:MAG: 30S ribosomal protein S14 [Gemmatimonadetes bacterium SCN 70-22]HMN09159.1 30S ribosomal protein S14 [Gemmatimonadaceae bacterium]
MAKTSKIVKNEERKVLVARHAEKRRALLATIKNPKTTDEEREAAYSKLRKLPRNSSRTRIRNRCSMTGRARGYEGYFGLSRLALREMALNGLIPGVRKASW